MAGPLPRPQRSGAFPKLCSACRRGAVSQHGACRQESRRVDRPRAGAHTRLRRGGGLAEHQGQRERPRSYVDVEGRLRNYVLPAFGNMAVAGVRPSDICAWVADLVAQGLAPASVHAIYQIAVQIFEQAVIDDLISRSPCRASSCPPTVTAKKCCSSAPSRSTTLADAIEDRYRVLIYTAAYGGLRAGELWRAARRSLQLLARTLDVVESLSEVARSSGDRAHQDRAAPHDRPARVPRWRARRPHRPLPVPRRLRVQRRRRRPHPASQLLRPPLPARRRACRTQPAASFPDLRHTCAALLIAAGDTSKRSSPPRALHDPRHRGSLRAPVPRRPPGARRQRSRTPYSERATLPRPTAARRKSGQLPEASAASKRAADQRIISERTTGFEPATLTLAR